MAFVDQEKEIGQFQARDGTDPNSLTIIKITYGDAKKRCEFFLDGKCQADRSEGYPCNLNPSSGTCWMGHPLIINLSPDDKRVV